ncbi:MAG: arylamine N-acetyltransferase [Devosia sp.]|nr:arylamine N-acetyltransferase [Devosia sp.]
MSEDVRLNAYFERIGFAGSIAPTLQTLEALHALHPAAIPFENLNSLLGLPVLLDQASLNRKLLGDRRGGYCFEHNLMFLRVLRELGFSAQGHLAGVLWGGRPVDELEPDHMTVTVELGGLTYLVDVGFGGLLQTVPLKLRTGVEQPTPLGTYRLTGEDPALRLEFLHHEGQWRPVYQFSLEAVADDAYAGISDTLNADPDWFFHHHLLVERAPQTGRKVLYDTRLTSHQGNAHAVQHLTTAEALRETLAGVFGMSLAGLAGLDEALGRLVPPREAGD